MVFGKMPVERELDSLIRAADKARRQAEKFSRQERNCLTRISATDKSVAPEFNVLGLAYTNQPGVLRAYSGNINLNSLFEKDLGRMLEQDSQTAIEYQGDTYKPVGPQGILAPNITQTVRIPSIDYPDKPDVFGLVFRASFALGGGVCPPSIMGETRTPEVFLREDSPQEKASNIYKLLHHYGHKCFAYHTKHMLNHELRMLSDAFE